MRQIARLAMIAALAAPAMLAAEARDAGAEEFQLTAGASHPPFLPWVSVLKEHVVPQAAERAKAKGHEIKWTEAYAGALFNFENALEGVEGGIADIAWVGTLWEPSKLPLTNVTFAAPFVTDDAVLAAQIQDEMYQTVPALKAQLESFNQVYLGPQAIDGYVIISKKPISSLEDLKGMKLYAPGAVARWLQGTGAIAVDGGLPVYYQGIETGITDGALVPGSGILPFKLHEVAPYVTVTQLGGCICGALTMNKDTWNKLPPEMQQMFKDVGKEYSTWVRDQVDAFYNKTIEILRKDPKVTIIEMPLEEQKKWAAALPDIAGDWIKDTEARGLPAKEVLKVFMDGTRMRGETPLRDWDKQ